MWLLRHRDLFFKKRFAGLPSSLCFLGLDGWSHLLLWYVEELAWTTSKPPSNWNPQGPLLAAPERWANCPTHFYVIVWTFLSEKWRRKATAPGRPALLRLPTSGSSEAATALDLFTKHCVSNTFPSEYSFEGETWEMFRRGWKLYPPPHLKATAHGTLPSFLKCFQKRTMKKKKKSTMTTCGPHFMQQIIFLRHQLCRFFQDIKL